MNAIEKVMKSIEKVNKDFEESYMPTHDATINVKINDIIKNILKNKSVLESPPSSTANKDKPENTPSSPYSPSPFNEK